jgi:hypothetical protein
MSMWEPDQSEIFDRLRLIEHMMAEGRRTTQRWGWMFLLWGIGPLLAIGWEYAWPDTVLAWPAVTLACILVNGAVMRERRRHGEARTPAMNAVGAVWASAGVAVLVLALAAAWSRALDLRGLCIMFFALAAVAHTASALMLRWPAQFLAALVWWAAALAAFILPAPQLRLLAAAALLAGNVAFGVWLTCREWKYARE